MSKLSHYSILAVLFVAAGATAARGQSAAPTPAAAQPQADASGMTEAAELSRKVVALYSERKFAEALPLAERALKLREAALGKDNVRVADAAGTYAHILLALGEWSKADDQLRRAVSIYEKSPAGQKSLSHARTLDALATVRRFEKSDFDGAAGYVERSIAIRGSLPGVSMEELIDGLYTLAELKELTRSPREAVALQRRVMEMREKEAAGGESTELYDLIDALGRFICLVERLKLKDEAARAEGRLAEVKEILERRGTAAPLPAIEGGVLNGKALTKPAPRYPRAALSARASGVVKVWITVNEQGRVIKANGCGHPLLTDAAVRAAYAATFSPTTLDGRPVKVKGTITYNFNIM